MRPQAVHHAAILVRDLARMEAFYRDLLGLALIRRWPAADGRGGDRSVWLDMGGGAFLALELTGAPDDHDHEREHPGHHLLALAIPREHRQQWERRLTEAGFPIYHRTDFTLYVRDPEGNRLGLSHYPDAEPAA